MTTFTDNPALHYAEEYADHSLCGLSLDGGDVDFTTDPDATGICPACMLAALRGPGPDPDYIDCGCPPDGPAPGEFNACGCYGQGYAHGKDKAHFEVRHLAGDNHAKDCGCEPCITARAVLRSRVYPDRASHDHCIFEAAKWAATMVFHAHGYSTGQQRVDAGIDVGGLTADCVQAAGADVGKAAGLGVAAAFRMLENLRAQADGTADAQGLDPAGRLRSWAGRYDGADGEDVPQVFHHPNREYNPNDPTPRGSLCGYIEPLGPRLGTPGMVNCPDCRMMYHNQHPANERCPVCA